MACVSTNLSNFIPIGTIFAYAGAQVPTGYLVCDGSSIDKDTYWQLYNVIGETFTLVPSPTVFSLPQFANTFVKASAVVDGITNPEQVPSVTSSFTLDSTNIPSFQCVGVSPNPKPFPTLAITNNGITFTTKSSTTGLNSLATSSQELYQGSTQVNNNVDITLGTWSPVYNGTNTPVSGTASFSGVDVSKYYEMTYIIRAWNNSLSAPNLEPVPLNYVQLPPSTAVNPNADNNTYGYI